MESLGACSWPGGRGGLAKEAQAILHVRDLARGGGQGAAAAAKNIIIFRDGNLFPTRINQDESNPIPLKDP